MHDLSYSFIIPVYNRPNEIDELLQSFTLLEGNFNYEIVIIEDGSNETSEEVIEKYNSILNISYYFKANSGPGDSRNFGMRKAKGNYFIILDSDVILPSNYLLEVDTYLEKEFFHCFGGPDAADESFTSLQKAINFSMTSVLTTGGIRGNKSNTKNFQPRSFNLGLSEDAFIATKGFGKIHPGEDPDLVLRLWKLGYKTSFIPDATVYHKRRISWRKFYNQVYKFGSVRPILNKWHPEYNKITFWFPSLFMIGLVVSTISAIMGHHHLIILYLLYFCLLFITALISTKSLKISLLSIFATIVQFYGYGRGFLVSSLKILFIKKPMEDIFPKLFFR